MLMLMPVADIRIVYYFLIDYYTTAHFIHVSLRCTCTAYLLQFFSLALLSLYEFSVLCISTELIAQSLTISIAHI